MAAIVALKCVLLTYSTSSFISSNFACASFFLRVSDAFGSSVSIFRLWLFELDFTWPIDDFFLFFCSVSGVFSCCRFLSAVLALIKHYSPLSSSPSSHAKIPARRSVYTRTPGSIQPFGKCRHSRKCVLQSFNRAKAITFWSASRMIRIEKPNS